MMNAAVLRPGSDYHPREEFLNMLFHALGVVFAVAALVWMLYKTAGSNMDLSNFQITGLSLYGASLIAMFLCSTLYHAFSNTRAKAWLKRLDHSSIFMLIAGTYTPILLIGLNNHKALVLFWVLWSVAILGIVFKLLFVHRFKKLSLFAYLAMGWLAVFIIPDMRQMLSDSALLWIVVGGALYTLGTLFYAAKQYRYTHAVWHLFVLGGALSHAWAIGQYVI